MAFATPKENEVLPGKLGPTPGQISTGGAGGAGGGTGGAAKSSATPGQNVPAQPSAQLSAYLGANQPQAEAFAGNVANTLGGQMAEAGNAINPAVNTYTGNLYSNPSDTALNEKVAKSPSSLTAEQRAAYKEQLGAAGKSPNVAGTFETTAPYQDITSKINKSVQQADLWNSGNDVGNLSTALAPFEGANATAGGKTLDALLLSRTPGAYSQIQGAIAPAAGLRGQLDAGTTQANKALQDAVATNAATTGAAQTSAQSYAKNLTDYLNQATTTAQDKQNAQRAAGGQAFTNYNANNLSAADAVALGIDQNQADAFATDFNALNPAIIAAFNANRSMARHGVGTGENIKPINLSSYLTQGVPGPDATPANVASAQDYSDIAALQEMLGTQAPTLPIGADTANQAGTGLNQATGSTLDRAGFNAALLPSIPQYQQYLEMIQSGAARNPAQTGAQQAAINEQVRGSTNILQYLRQLTGQQGAGITPPSGGGYRTNV